MVAVKPGLYKESKGLQLSADYSLTDIENLDILVIPGGFGIDAVLLNQEIISWIQHAHSTSQWTVSVCSGALLLGAAELLKDRKATTHWNRKEQLLKYGAIIENERYVKDGKIITSAGVLAGIDMSLYLLSLVLMKITQNSFSLLWNMTHNLLSIRVVPKKHQKKLLIKSE